MNKSLWQGVGAAVILAATAMACGGGGSTPTTPTPPTATPPPTTAPPPTAPPSTATITIGAGGTVSPSTVTIARGGRVTMVNSHTQPHEMASDPHPDHTNCPELNDIGFLSPGQSRTSGNLNTARTCGFHDHNQPNIAGLTGSIIIQ